MVNPSDDDEDEAAPEAAVLLIHNVLIPPAAPAARLDRFLADALPALSRARIQSLMEAGRVLVDGQPARASQKARGGQRVEVREPRPLPVALLPQDLPLSILYQDADIVVVDKAAGRVVHPALGNPDGTLVNALLFHVKDLGGISGELRPGIVHRLDRDTSGVLVVAKHDAALVALQRQFKDRTTEKRYLALVRGVPAPSAGTWCTPFGRHPVQRQKFTARAGDRQAVTDWRTLATGSGGISAVELVLHTGRTHQVRVHLSEHGLPILGDDVYGGRAAELAPRQMLHAALLCLDQPVRCGRMRFVAPLPADLEDTAQRFGLLDAVRAWATGLADGEKPLRKRALRR
ncbi:MAG: RluA family pseudouridine synthase [Deltaproteobacteria bacterium]|nr:RluA family pseudouridine synthase [Deltaproteobacteria bacterium]